MATKRRYGQACPVAHALDLVGERWALLVIRELRLGGRRYVDLEASLPGIGPSMLSQRLRDLEDVGLVSRRRLPPPAAAQVYELTDRGAELEPVFGALAAWGMRSPELPLDGDLSEDAVMLGLRMLVAHRPDGATGWTASYRVELERETYTLRVEDGTLTELVRGEPAGLTDAVIHTDRHVLHAVLTGQLDVDDALAGGRLGVDGAERAVRQLLAAARPR